MEAQRLADIACGDANPTRDEAMHLAQREKRWRRVEALLRERVDNDYGELAADCLRIVDQESRKD